MKNEGHVKLRRGLLEHINSGKMKSDMLSIYTYLLLKADYTCGVVWGISAPYIGIKLRKPAKYINRQLIKLEKEQYIKRFGHRGQISSYEILINKYLVFNGVLIDAVNSIDINNIAWSCGLKGELSGSYHEVKRELSVFKVSPYKEIKNIIIKEKNNMSILFNSFWNKYHQITKLPRTNKKSAEKHFKSLSKTEQQKAIDKIQLFWDSLKDKTYCNKARTYLSDKLFENEFRKAYGVV